MSTRVRDRRFKPQWWQVRREFVDPSCEWAWRGLELCWPLWEGGFDTPSASYGPQYEIRDIAGNAHHGQLSGFSTDCVDFVGSTRGIVARSIAAPGHIGSADGSAWLPTNEITLVFHYRKTDTTNRESQATGILSGSNAQACNIFLPWVDGTVYWDYGNNGSFGSPNRISVAGLSFGDDVWAFANGPEGMQIWQNGIKRAQGSTGATRTATTTERFALFRGSITVQADLAECGIFSIYNRQLGAAEIGALAVDPYTPLRPSFRRPLKAGSGGGGGSGARSFVPAMIG